MNKPVAFLNCWTRFAGDQLTGVVYGHPHQDDREQVYTSSIENAPPILQMGSIVETRNTIYVLGEPA